MPIKVTCPKCQGVLHAPDDAGGKRGKCPTCGTVLSIPEDPGRGMGGAPNGGPRSMPDTGFDPSGAPAPPANRSSAFGMGPDPALPPAPAPTRSAPPPAFGGPSPSRLPDPFARPGKKSAARPGDASDGLIRAWKRARRGLWWVAFALFLFVLAPLSVTGIGIAENFGTKLPSQSPGYLKIDTLPTDAEIKAAAIVIPVVLGLLCLVLGRFGFSNVPRASFAKGLAVAAAGATLVGFIGILAFATPTVMQLVEGFVPQSLLPEDDINGVIQRAGLLAAAVMLPLADLAFIIALGRLGAGLQNARLASRGTRFLVYLGLVVIVTAVYWFLQLHYPRTIESFVTEQVQPQWDKLGTHKVSTVYGLLGLAGLIVWFWHARLVSAGRRAIREWLDDNEPGN